MRRFLIGSYQSSRAEPAGLRQIRSPWTKAGSLRPHHSWDADDAHLLRAPRDRLLAPPPM